jgi:hypothetical protein
VVAVNGARTRFQAWTEVGSGAGRRVGGRVGRSRAVVMVHPPAHESAYVESVYVESVYVCRRSPCELL